MRRYSSERRKLDDRHGRPARGKPSLVEVTIHGLAGGGDGVARLPTEENGADPGVVFVPDTAPFDRALVSVAHPPGRRRWQWGQLVEVRESGPGRREPGCDLSLLCGGCQWHHLSYEAQLAGKGEILARAMRQARLDLPVPKVTPAPRSLAYRARARLHLQRRSDGTMEVGFRARRSHRLVETLRCPVLVPALQALLPRLGQALRGAPEGEVLLLASPSGACGLALRPSLGAAKAQPGIAASLGESFEGALALAELVGSDGEPLETWGDPWLDLALLGEESHLGAPHLFAQANSEVNQVLRARLAAWAAEALASPAAFLPDSSSGSSSVPASAGSSTSHRILELYAGSGNLTRDLAALGPLVAVESEPGAVALGRRNLGNLPVLWRAQGAPEALEALLAEGPPGSEVDLVVLDPPRTGAREAIGPLVALAPRTILYASCEPMTLVRDAALLVQAGYVPTRLEAFDTMPQTAHFETLMELTRFRAPG